MATTIGLLHPGEMGSVVGAAARAGGARVLWVSGGRSAATRSRANAAGLEDARALSELVSQSDMILSNCPPANALDIAREVASLVGVVGDTDDELFGRDGLERLGEVPREPRLAAIGPGRRFANAGRCSSRSPRRRRDRKTRSRNRGPSREAR